MRVRRVDGSAPVYGRFIVKASRAIVAPDWWGFECLFCHENALYRPRHPVCDSCLTTTCCNPMTPCHFDIAFAAERLDRTIRRFEYRSLARTAKHPSVSEDTQSKDISEITR